MEVVLQDYLSSFVIEKVLSMKLALMVENWHVLLQLIVEELSLIVHINDQSDLSLSVMAHLILG